MDKAGAEVGAKTRRQRISQLGRRTRLSDDSDSESMLSDQSDLFCTQRSETKDKLYPAVAVKKLLQETKNIKRSHFFRIYRLSKVQSGLTSQEVYRLRKLWPK